MDKHIDNDLLRFDVNLSREANIETNKSGHMKGLRTVVTIQNKNYLYNPSKLSKGFAS